VAGFVAYFATFFFFGFEPRYLFNMVNLDAYARPPDYAPFNPNSADLGNPSLGVGDCSQVKPDSPIDWMWDQDAKYDLRNIFVKCVNGRWEPAIEWADCDIERNISSVTDYPTCYSTEAHKCA